MGRFASVVLPVLTLVLGIAIGKWWGDREHAADRGREEAARSAERRLVAPPSPERPRRADGTDPAAPTPAVADPQRGVTIPAASADPAMVPAPVPAVAPTDPKAAEAPKGGAAPAEEQTVPAGPADGDPDAAAAKMLAVLFTNPAFRDKMVDQMVAQVGKQVTFTDSQREAAKTELSAAMQPLVEAFQKGPVDFKELDPKFQVVKEDWKRRLTPLLTAEQGLAFQKWLDEKHSLQVKMGMDEKGQPTDPDEHEEK